MTLAIGSLTNFGLLFPMVFFCVCLPSFVEAALSVIKVYCSYIWVLINDSNSMSKTIKTTARYSATVLFWK